MSRVLFEIQATGNAEPDDMWALSKLILSNGYEVTAEFSTGIVRVSERIEGHTTDDDTDADEPRSDGSQEDGAPDAVGTTHEQQESNSDRVSEERRTQCPNCGQHYPRSYSRCPDCGAPNND